MDQTSSRRGFLGADAAASLASGLMVYSSVAAAEEVRELRLGIVVCGDRFTRPAHGSLVAVMGWLAAYSGQGVAWDFVTTESQPDLFPEGLVWEGALPAPAHAIPGRTKLV